MYRPISLAEMVRTVADLRPPSKFVLTNGCFDLLHVGHVRYLTQAKSLGDFLIVGLNSDASVKRLKGDSRPIQTQADRAEILSSLRCVDFVVIFDDDTPMSLIEKIRPDVLVKGGDWPLDQIVGGSWVKSYGGEVISLPFHEGHSTTGLIKASCKAP